MALARLAKTFSLPVASHRLLTRSTVQPQLACCAFYGTDVKIALKDTAKREFFKKKYTNCLAILDRNKDGLLTRSDVTEIADDHKTLGLSLDNYKKLVKEYERISDCLGLFGPSTELPLKEATENWIKYLETTNLDTNLEKTRFRVMFNNVDTNRDGEITFDEWENHCFAYNVKPFARTSFDAMDIDKDGKISYEEFSAFLYEFFYSADNDLCSGILYGPID